MNLYYLNSLDIISKSFNTPLEFLNSIFNSEVNSTYIELFNIPKKNPKHSKKYREVINIKSSYNLFYKELLCVIEQIIGQNEKNFVSDIAHGFIKNRGVFTNAKQHLNKKYLFKIDIKDFFKSIPQDGISNTFLKLGCSQDGANLLSTLSTFNGILYEGFNTSPILANLYCYNLDLELIKLADSYDVIVTRYSDDITFSSDTNSFPSIDEIEKILKQYFFNINHEKTLYLKYGQPQYVTGLSISNDKYPRVPKRLKKKIRQNLYYMNKYPENYFYKEDNYAVLRAIYGHIVYLLGIEKSLGKKYQSEFINIIENYLNLEDIYINSPQKKSTLSTYHYIDESEFIDSKTNKYYLILSLISINGEFQKNMISDKINALKNDLASDFRNGLNDEQRSKLFHYCEDNISVKEKYISILRELNIEAHIIFKYEDKPMKKQDYQDNYYALFNSLMKNILRRYKNNTNVIVVEENSKISINTLEKSILNRRFFFPNIEIAKASKDDVLLSIPDYILGIVRDCLKKDFLETLEKLKAGQRLKEDIKFDEISNKIRLIANLNNSNFFTRQNNSQLTCIKLNQYIHHKRILGS